jgi:hypothetical protein
MQMCRRESGFVNRNFRQQEVNRPSIGDGAMLAGRERNNRPEGFQRIFISRNSNVPEKRPHIAEPASPSHLSQHGRSQLQELKGRDSAATCTFWQFSKRQDVHLEVSGDFPFSPQLLKQPLRGCGSQWWNSFDFSAQKLCRAGCRQNIFVGGFILKGCLCFRELA